MPPPNDQERPLFTYGALKPDELAHGQVERFVDRSAHATIEGILHLRDGLPLLEPHGGWGPVRGYLVWFDEATAPEAWKAVCHFEPKHQYFWGVGEAADPGGDKWPCNVLLGKKLNSGVSGDPITEWSARLDPVFVEGLHEAHLLIGESALAGPPRTWADYFRLQAGYLLLWTVMERYTALRFGAGLKPNAAKLERLTADPMFRRAVASIGVSPDEVYDSRNPETRYRIEADGSGAIDYWYAMRSNLSHRGKGTFHEAERVLKAANDLHRLLRELLVSHVPAIEEAWRRLDEDRASPYLHS